MVLSSDNLFPDGERVNGRCFQVPEDILDETRQSRDETERQAEPAGACAAAAAANGHSAEGLLANAERDGTLRAVWSLAGQSAHPHRNQGLLLRSVLSDLYCP